MGLPRAEVNARLDAAMAYGKKLPSSNGKTAVIGFCWGGAGSFAYAAAQVKVRMPRRSSQRSYEGAGKSVCGSR